VLDHGSLRLGNPVDLTYSTISVKFKKMVLRRPYTLFHFLTRLTNFLYEG